MTLGAVLAALSIRWRWIVGCVVIGLMLGVTATLLTPPTYRATVTMYVSAQYPGDSASAAYQGSLLTTQRMASYTQLLTNEEVAAEVVNRLVLPQTPQQLADQMTATAEADSVLLTLQVRDHDPGAAAAIANTAGESFSGLVARLERPLDQNRPPLIVVRTVRPASLPVIKVAPQPLLNIAVAGFLSLLVGIGAGLTRHLTDSSIRSERDLEEASEAPTLGVVPFEKELSNNIRAFADSPLSEAVRQVRANLQFTDVDVASKVILISSCRPGEGKSTLAINLAQSLTLAGFRTVLLEVDLRRPTIGRSLGLDPTVGLTSVLSGRTRLGEALQHFGDGRLDVITSGHIPPNPGELLGSTTMQGIVSKLRETYDYLILDSPPVLAVADAAQLSASVDSAVLVSRFGLSHAVDVRRAAGALRQVGIKISGTVLNASPARTASYRYGYAAQEPSENTERGALITRPPAVDRPSPQPRSRKTDSGSGQGHRPSHGERLGDGSDLVEVEGDDDHTTEFNYARSTNDSPPAAACPNPSKSNVSDLSRDPGDPASPLGRGLHRGRS